MINFLDTSAILNGALSDYSEIHIDSMVISELENIKTSHLKDEVIKASARQVAKRLLKDNKFVFIKQDTKKIQKYLKKYSLAENNDNKILCSALIYAHENKASVVRFITSDVNLFLLAKLFEEKHMISTCFYEKENDREDLNYTGSKSFCPEESALASCYSNPNYNILNAKTNQYCTIKNCLEDVLDIFRWSGEKYEKLNYKSFKSVLGEKISPRNTEQKMLFDLLQNRTIPVKLCLGRFGSGKSFLMLAHALYLIQKGEFDKIIFVKNNIEVKDTGRIGMLPGNEREKLAPFIQQIADHIGQDALNTMLDDGIIEPVHLGFMRGRDIKNAIILCDEVENMTKQHIQLLIGRVSSGSELWLAGDLKQTDSINFEKNSGIKALIRGLMGNKLFGMVKLIKSERSQVAALADQLD